MRKRLIAVVFTVTFLVISFLGAVTLVAVRGRGVGDLLAFTAWSIPAAAFLLICRFVLTSFTASWRPGAAYTAHALVGTVAGFAWTFVVSAGLGPWFQAFSFPVLPPWMLASGVAFVCAEVAMHLKGWAPASLAACLPVLCVILLSYAAPTRQLDAIIVLREGVTDSDARLVRESVLGRRHPSGRGYRHAPGLAGIGGWDVDGKKGFRVSFHRGVDAKRRAELIRQIRESNLVADVKDVQPPR